MEKLAIEEIRAPAAVEEGDELHDHQHAEFNIGLQIDPRLAELESRAERSRRPILERECVDGCRNASPIRRRAGVAPPGAYVDRASVIQRADDPGDRSLGVGIAPVTNE